MDIACRPATHLVLELALILRCIAGYAQIAASACDVRGEIRRGGAPAAAVSSARAVSSESRVEVANVMLDLRGRASHA
jgi:hypothetical protein